MNILIIKPYIKSNLNNNNIFHVENGFMNEDNQLSQMMFMNRGEEKSMNK